MFFTSNLASFLVPVGGSSAATANVAPNPADRDLIRSAYLLSSVAYSRAGGTVRPAELLEMATDSRGHYRPEIQHAARVFLANYSAVHRAREAIRRRNANPHSACAGGRAYNFQDLQSIGDYMQQHQHEQQGHQEQGQHGGYRPFTQGMDANVGGHGSFGLVAQMAAAIQHLMSEMINLRRHHMSLERLMSMGHRGNPGAQYFLNEPDMLANLINGEVRRNMAITLGNLQSMGFGIAMPEHGAGVGDFHGVANAGWQGGMPGGQWQGPAFPDSSGSPGLAGFGDVPDFYGLLGTSVPSSPAPGFSGADDVGRHDDMRQRQQASDVQLRQDEHQRFIRQEALRKIQLQVAQQQAGALVKQRQIEDDVAADRWVADGIAAQQRQVAEIRAQQIREDEIRAAEIQAAEIRAEQK